jgi:glycerol-3-phosphate O-acyltransferase
MLTVTELKSDWETAILDVQETNSAALKIKEELESRLKRALELQELISNLENSEDYMSEDQVNESRKACKTERLKILKATRLSQEIRTREMENEKAR